MNAEGAETAPDSARQRTIETLLDAVWESSGGAQLLQDMALLGCVHGSVDLILRFDELFANYPPDVRTRQRELPIAQALDAARLLRVEIVESPRAVPLLDQGDYRRINAFIIRSEQQITEVERAGLAHRVLNAVLGERASLAARRARREIVEILTASHRMVRVDGKSIDAGPNALGALPVVHIQNASQPFRYEGLSDVEPLIPLQDELNIRLCDRAHRVTLQSFNMYLAKGIETTGEARIAPGQVWLTDNPDASIEAFGGDGHSPSEESHIEQVRDAMDKVSSVSPVAIGVVREKLGHLSSENALRITMTGVLSKTARKRLSYGRGLAEMSRLILRALDLAGVLRTSDHERGVRLDWQDPLPADDRERLTAAQMKIDLGVPRDRVLAELGYGSSDTGVA